MTRIFFIALLALTVGRAFQPDAVAAEAQGKKYALLVGINEYDHDKLRKLDYAVNDAMKLGELLKKYDYEVRLLTDGSKDKPTKKNIESALDEILEKFRKGDTVLIGYAGHGLQFGKDCYFCPQDGKPFAEEVKTLVSLTQVYNKLERGYSGVKLVLVDACRDDGSRGIRGGADDAPQPPKGVGVLLSCSDGEKASESKALEHGVFFYHVIKGLEGQAKERDEDVVTWDSLRSYVKKQVPREALKLFPDMRKQNPNEIGNLSGVPPVLVSLTSVPRVDAKVEKQPASELISFKVGTASELISFKVGTETFRMQLVKIKGGTFEMGSSKEELALTKEKFAYEPKNEVEHEVELSAFLLGQHPVTRGQFRLFVKDADFKTEAEKDGQGGWGYNAEKNEFGRNPKYSWRECGFSQTDEHPVVNVTWNDARAFCEWLGRKSGRKVRLPSEAQWEYACRAGTKTLYYTGNDPGSLEGHANVGDQSLKNKKIDSRNKYRYFDFDDGEAFTSAVKKYKGNPWGLFDMTGNVWQWCEDGYRKDYENLKGKDPTGEQSNDDRVLRGGSWGGNPEYCRSAVRNFSAPDLRYNYVGFRVALLP